MKFCKKANRVVVIHKFAKKHLENSQWSSDTEVDKKNKRTAMCNFNVKTKAGRMVVWYNNF